MISGRTKSIISRFPRFYRPDDPESSFFQILEVFGTTLNQAEQDLMRVLRSHFVGTAENVNSEGFTGKQKGDLDRIFAFYLEQFGGTSQLSYLNPQLQVGEFKQLDEFIKMLLEAEREEQTNSSLTTYLWKKTDEKIQKLLHRSAVENARFQDTLDYPTAEVQGILQIGEKKQALLQLPLSREMKSKLEKEKAVVEPQQLSEELTAAWLLNLLSRQDSLSQYLKSSFSPENKQLLEKYDGSVPVPLEMKKAIASHLNQNVLRTPLFAQQVLRHHQELSAQVTCLQTLINYSKEKETTTFQKVGNFLLPRLSPGLQIALAESETESQLTALYLRLTSELRPQLQSPRLATQVCQQLKQSQTPDLNLSKDAYVILWQAVRTALAEVLEELVPEGHQWVIWVELLRRYERSGRRSHIQDIPNLETLQSPFLPFLQPLLQRPDLCRSLDSLGQEADYMTTDSTLPEETFQEVWKMVGVALDQKSLKEAFAEITQATQQELISRFRNDPPKENQAIANQVRVMLAQFLLGGISSTSPSASPAPEKSLHLPVQLSKKLNKLFADPTNCQQLLTIFEQVEELALPPDQRTKDQALTLPQQEIRHLLGALVSASQTILREQLNATRQQRLSQLQLAPDLQAAIAQKPSGEHLERLNRRLLEAVFPAEIPPSRIPASSEIAKALAEEFNAKVLGDRNFYTQLKDFFTQLPLSLTTQSFIQDYEDYQNKPDKFPTERLTFLNRLLLESAYPRQIERCDTPYRERLKRLIGVLKNGASPSDGIIEIVAANLGMNTDPTQPIKPWEEYLFDLPSDIESHLNSLDASKSEGLRNAFSQSNVTLSVETTISMEEWMQVWVLSDGPRGQVYRLHRHSAGFSVYRQLIRVIEYQAGSQKQQIIVHPNPSNSETSTFTLNNPSTSTESPTLELTLQDSRLGSKERKLPPFKVLCIRNKTTKEFIEYRGGFDIGEVLRFSADGSVLERGTQVKQSTISGKLPSLSSDNSTWCIEAEIDLEGTKFDESNLDFARFESELEQNPLQTPQMECYKITISIIRQQLVYGTFTVQIPWDIPGYTDRFNETKDHPRHQIYSLIDKVRAAGISFSIVYEKFPLPEKHEIEDKLDTNLVPSEVKQKKLYDDRSSNMIEHKMSDELILAQMFDYTYFDSLNTFS